MASQTFGQEPAGPRSRSRAMRTAGALTVAAAAVGAVLFWGATAQATAAAAVSPTVTPSPSKTEGNATDCNTGHDPVGLKGSILLSDLDTTEPGVGTGTVDAGNKILTVQLDAGVTASGVVVKGGSNYNVYTGPFVGEITITGMHAPLVGNDKNIPTISHWFVCGGPTTTETTTTTTTTTTTSTSTSTDGTTPGTPGTTTTPGGSLPVTGTAIGGIVLAGVALIGGGAALLFFRRRRDAASTS